MNNKNDNLLYSYTLENESLSQEFTLISLGKRMESTEKFLIFFEELLKLKKEERLAEHIINNSTLNEIDQRLMICEEDFKSLIKKRNVFVEESLKKLERFEQKVLSVIDEKTVENSNLYASSLGEMEALIKKNEFLIENTFQTKLLYFYQILNSKFEDILNILEDLSTKTENNDADFNNNKKLIQMIQQDHMDFFTILNILKENSSKLDLSNEQLSELKFKFNKILNILNGDDYQE